MSTTTPRRPPAPTLPPKPVTAMITGQAPTPVLSTASSESSVSSPTMQNPIAPLRPPPRPPGAAHIDTIQPAIREDIKISAPDVKRRPAPPTSIDSAIHKPHPVQQHHLHPHPPPPAASISESGKSTEERNKNLSMQGKVLFRRMTADSAEQEQQQAAKILNDKLSNGNESATVEPITDEEIKALSNYFRAVFELVTSEFNYATDLVAANLLLLQPLQEKFGIGLAVRIFSIWTTIMNNHDVLLTRKKNELVWLNDDENGNETGSENGIMRLNSHTSMVNSLESVKLKKIAQDLDRFEDSINSSFKYINENRSARNKLEKLGDDIDRLARSLAMILKDANDILEVSVSYIANYPSALQYLDDLANTKPAAIQFINQLESNPIFKGLQLRDYLIKPVQRLCKYPLLVREMMKYSKNPKTKQLLEESQKSLQKIANNVNAIISKYEQDYDAKLVELKGILKQSEVQKYNMHLDDCKLVRISDLKIEDVITGSDATFPKSIVKNDKTIGYLFRDQLLILEPSNKLLGHHKLRVSHQVSFLHNNGKPVKIDVSESQENRNFFSLYVRNSKDGSLVYKITFSVGSVTLKEGWVSDLQTISEIFDKVDYATGQNTFITSGDNRKSSSSSTPRFSVMHGFSHFASR